MTYDIVATGSTGNAVVIDRYIMIDCGVSYKRVREFVPWLGLILLTHRHSDHINPRTLKRIAEARPSVRFGCCSWLYAELAAAVPLSQIDVYEIGKKYSYGAWALSPVRLYHDVPQCGYRLYHGDERAFFATDTAHLEGIKAEGYDLYLIEANYGEDELREREAAKRERGEFAYETYVPDRHLSREQASAFILANAGDKSEVVFLHAHVKKEGD